MKRFVVIEYLNGGFDERALKDFDTKEEAIKYIEVLKEGYTIIDEDEEGWFVRDNTEEMIDVREIARLEKIAELKNFWDKGYIFIDIGYDDTLEEFSEVEDMVNEVHYGQAGLELKIDTKENKTIEMIIIDHWNKEA